MTSRLALANYRHRRTHEVYTDAWLDLVVLGLVAGRTYDHVATGPRWCRWLWERAARCAIRRLFRERKNDA